MPCFFVKEENMNRLLYRALVLILLLVIGVYALVRFCGHQLLRTCLHWGLMIEARFAAHR